MKKIIVVTGASSGMGKEFLIQIIEKEPNVDEIWAIAREEKRLNELKEKMRYRKIKELEDERIEEEFDIEKDTDARGYPKQGETGCTEAYHRGRSKVCYYLVKGPAGLLGILPLYVLPG